MKRYIFAVLCFFDNENKIVNIYADDPLQAIIELGHQYGIEVKPDYDIEKIKEILFSCEFAVSDPYEVI
jgi:hypothetical protein